MPIYRVELAPRAVRQLGKLPKQARESCARAIDSLVTEPRPPGCKKLSGAPTDYRIRVGHYRVVYEIRDNALLVLVVAVAHRKRVYKSH